ncbi:DUF1501 domain-containing protein [Novosphingobium aquiterrae]|uniref:DUF1501 domain-containing protein n=1 Tax=Novosphingobium aquiterrae TaxID=624388 RepID=A0ABV6PLK7_9SPHN
MKLDRRQILAAGAASLFAPRIAFARAATERRLVFIIQRGAADGLATLAPLGDKAYSGLRGDLANLEGGARLDPLFTLHPALAQTAQLYGAKQALFAHAIASPYRERSHFDAQNVLETGGTVPYARKDGWMNRLLSLLPAGEARALAVSATIPAALRGDNPVASYAPSNLPDAPGDLLQRVSQLYAGDPQLHGLWEEALQTRAMAAGTDLAGARGGEAAGKLVASLMSGAQGARVVMVETTGWDTHAQQKGRLAAQLGGLDALIGALKEGLGPTWNDTLVIVATEFGRTAAVNGTGGTDHGTGALAMLLGGTVAGGRILADWPGLAPAQLYEGRDLKPTIALDALLSGAIAGHFSLDPAIATARLFPETAGKPLSGLIRA